MNKTSKIIMTLVLSTLFIGCVPAPKVHVGTTIGTNIGTSVGGGREVSVGEYGHKPSNYIVSIKNYFSTKLKRASLARYKFSNPKRAYKRRGLAYGGDIGWKGWLVETSVTSTSRTGRLLTPKPYLVLFSGNQIVEDILGNTHKLLVKVDK